MEHTTPEIPEPVENPSEQPQTPSNPQPPDEIRPLEEPGQSDRPLGYT